MKNIYKISNTLIVILLMLFTACNQKIVPEPQVTNTPTERVFGIRSVPFNVNQIETQSPDKFINALDGITIKLDIGSTITDTNNNYTYLRQRLKVTNNTGRYLSNLTFMGISIDPNAISATRSPKSISGRDLTQEEAFNPKLALKGIDINNTQARKAIGINPNYIPRPIHARSRDGINTKIEAISADFVAYKKSELQDVVKELELLLNGTEGVKFQLFEYGFFVGSLAPGETGTVDLAFVIPYSKDTNQTSPLSRFNFVGAFVTDPVRRITQGPLEVNGNVDKGLNGTLSRYKTSTGQIQIQILGGNTRSVDAETSKNVTLIEDILIGFTQPNYKEPVTLLQNNFFPEVTIGQSTIQVTDPSPNLPQNGLKAIAIATGGNFSLALTPEKKVLAWGNNNYGQLGNSTTQEQSLPIQVSNLENIIQISSSNCHSLAVDIEGHVYSWGCNRDGQLGNGGFKSELKPIKVEGLNNIIQVSVGRNYSLALTQDGTIWGWGRNNDGQLGNARAAKAQRTPIRLNGLPKIKQISAGVDFALALSQDGNVWGWGENNDGQLGNNTRQEQLSPLKINELNNIKQIAAGNRHSLALDQQGNVFAWGVNIRDQIGNLNVPNIQLTPIKVVDATQNVQQITTGIDYSIAFTSEGNVLTWGTHITSNIGNTTIIAQKTPTRVDGLQAMKKISAAVNYTLTLSKDDYVFAWGDNFAGQLGNGTKQNQIAPTAVKKPPTIHTASTFGKVQDKQGNSVQGATISLAPITRLTHAKSPEDLTSDDFKIAHALHENTTTSNSQGAFVFKGGIATGEYSMTIKKNGFPEFKKDIKVENQLQNNLGEFILGQGTSVNTVTLTIQVQGDGNVTSNVGGIKCRVNNSGICQAQLTKGTKVNLTQQANINSTFSKWSGDCNGNGSCYLTLNNNTNVTALFAKNNNNSTPNDLNIVFDTDLCNLENGGSTCRLETTTSDFSILKLFTGSPLAEIKAESLSQGQTINLDLRIIRSPNNESSFELSRRTLNSDSNTATLDTPKDRLPKGNYIIEIIASEGNKRKVLTYKLDLQ